MIVAKIEITMDEKGQLAVSAPLDQDVLCYGMLEKAKLTIQMMKIASATQVVKPTFEESMVVGKAGR